MYIWLKVSITKTLFDEWKKNGLVGDVEIKKDKQSSKLYIEIMDDNFSPVLSLPDIPTEYIERFTYKNKDVQASSYHHYGVYRHKNAEMVVKKGAGDRYSFDVGISSQDYISMKEVYSLFLRRAKDPDERWEIE